MTRTIALLGHPVSHSLSPAFQQAALDATGIDARYEAWDTEPDDLRIAVERLRSGDVLGANVTVPHKVAVMALVDAPDAVAERAGAVNTIVNRHGRLEATNTDILGVLRTLDAARVEVHGQRIALLGAGGAARAVILAMHQAGAARVTVINRSTARVSALNTLAVEGLDLRYAPLDPADATFLGAIRTAAVIVNATPLGMTHGPAEEASPIPAGMLTEAQVAFDLVYTPEETPFLRDAAACGARPVGGLGMLIYQGAASFRLWTGIDPPVDVMFAAARAALAARS